MIKDKILVVGGAGYIGAHIVDLLCSSGYDVIVYDNLCSGFKENLNKNAIFIEGDTLNQKRFDELFKDHNINSVVHLAAFKAAGESMNAIDKYSKNNIIGSLNVISSVVKHDVKNFIFSSTAAVYGNPIYNPIDEGHPLNPINHYGFTKLYIEKYLKWMSDLNKINYVALRYFNVAGYSEKDNLIKSIERNPQNLIPIVMEVANGTKKKMKIFGNDYNTKDGTCIRDYISVIDLADAHLKSIEYLNSRNTSLVVNLSTGKGSSVLEVIKNAQKISGKSIKYSIGKRRQGDPETLFASYNKAESELGWRPNFSNLDSIIKSAWTKYKG